MTMFLRALHSEWLKRRRSFASALVVAGSLFTPAVIIAVRLIHHRGLPELYASAKFWADLWRASWESMAVFFLPLIAIMATSLIVQIEFRGNAWKQVHALPLRPSTIFFAKLAVVVIVMLGFLVLFNGGVYAAAMLPYLLVPGVPPPKGAFTSLPLLHDNARYALESLPIVAAQYLLALRSPNVLAPIGIGFLAWVGALASVSSRIAVWWPYGFTIIEYIKGSPKGAHLAGAPSVPWIAAAYFVTLTAAGWTMFVTRKDKG